MSVYSVFKGLQWVWVDPIDDDIGHSIWSDSLVGVCRASEPDESAVWQSVRDALELRVFYPFFYCFLTYTDNMLQVIREIARDNVRPNVLYPDPHPDLEGPGYVYVLAVH